MTASVMQGKGERALELEQGSISYEVSGEGPLVVLVPGMGDVRSTWRHVAPALARGGMRVACTDLRGHGGSDTTFEQYGDEATAADILALIEHLGGPALVAGNSMGAGAAVLAAAARPDLVRGLVLVGPFVRDPGRGRAARLMTRAAMARPWAARAWLSYLPRLYAGTRPPDLDEHLGRIAESLRRPGAARAFSLTTRTRHGAAEQALARVKAPAIVVMGELDPDFPDPSAEADWIAGRLSGEAVIAPDCAHYPQSQRPELVIDAITRISTGTPARA